MRIVPQLVTPPKIIISCQWCPNPLVYLQNLYMHAIYWVVDIKWNKVSNLFHIYFVEPWYDTTSDDITAAFWRHSAKYTRRHCSLNTNKWNMTIHFYKNILWYMRSTSRHKQVWSTSRYNFLPNFYVIVLNMKWCTQKTEGIEHFKKFSL